MNTDNSVVIFTQASLMLAEADTIQKAKELKSLALTAAEWAKRKNMGEDAIQYCRSYALEAERKMGEMLAATERAKGAKGNPGGRGATVVQSPGVTTQTPTLVALGVTKRESAEAQMLASLPLEDFEAIRNGKTTKLQVKREIKEAKREGRREENRVKAKTAENPAESGARFATIVLDPPWDWGDEGDCDQLGRAAPTYATMSLEKLLTLPVGELADVDCHIYLWITNRSLPKGFALLDKWGFRYITTLTWIKSSFGMGNYFRGSTEQVLFGVRGSQPLKRKDVGTWFAAPRGPNGHSSKPSEFFSLVESCSPGPYLEMFARESRPGWKLWGADVPA